MIFKVALLELGLSTSLEGWGQLRGYMATYGLPYILFFKTYFSSGITACVLSKNPALPSAALNQAITLELGLLMYSDSEKGSGRDNNTGPHFPWKSQPCFPACLSTEEAAQQPCFV